MPGGHAPYALLNQTGNRALRALLRSPLHGPLSGRLALITVTGRESGRQFTIPVGYTRRGNVIEIAVGWPERKRWWRNLRGEGAPVRMRVRGEELVGHAVARGDEQSGVLVEVDLRPRYS